MLINELIKEGKLMLSYYNHYRWFYSPSEYIKHPIHYTLSTFDNMWKNVGEFFSWVRSLSQRGIRGYADSDVWDIGYYLTSVLIPMLERLKEVSHGCPMDSTEEEWNKELDDMIEGFKAAKRVIEDSYYEETNSDILEREPTSDEINGWIRLSEKDQKLFRKYSKRFISRFFDLWD